MRTTAVEVMKLIFAVLYALFNDRIALHVVINGRFYYGFTESVATRKIYLPDKL